MSFSAYCFLHLLQTSPSIVPSFSRSSGIIGGPVSVSGMSRVVYDLAVDSWCYSDTLVICSPHGTEIASFPIQFIQTGGQNTWTYVLWVIERLIETSSVESWSVHDTDGRKILPEDVPRAGSYTLKIIPAGKGPAAGKKYVPRDTHILAHRQNRDSQVVQNTSSGSNPRILKAVCRRDQIPRGLLSIKCVRVRSSQDSKVIPCYLELNSSPASGPPF